MAQVPTNPQKKKQWQRCKHSQNLGVFLLTLCFCEWHGNHYRMHNLDKDDRLQRPSCRTTNWILLGDKLEKVCVHKMRLVVCIRHALWKLTWKSLLWLWCSGLLLFLFFVVTLVSHILFFLEQKEVWECREIMSWVW